MTEFTPTQRSRIKRYHERGHYDKATVYEILDAAFMCHIAYVIDDQPYCTPTAYWRDGDTLYWHGSSASRMLRQHSKGIPVCLTVTHMDGLVLARSGFHSSINYRSVMAYGTAQKIENDDQKLQALLYLLENLGADLRALTVELEILEEIERLADRHRRDGRQVGVADKDMPGLQVQTSALAIGAGLCRQQLREFFTKSVVTLQSRSF